MQRSYLLTSVVLTLMKTRETFSMFATTMYDLFAVSDMGEIMPPKSTWFEPKLKDGLLVHMI